MTEERQLTESEKNGHDGAPPLPGENDAIPKGRTSWRGWIFGFTAVVLAGAGIGAWVTRSQWLPQGGYGVPSFLQPSLPPPSPQAGPTGAEHLPHHLSVTTTTSHDAAAETLSVEVSETDDPDSPARHQGTSATATVDGEILAIRAAMEEIQSALAQLNARVTTQAERLAALKGMTDQFDSLNQHIQDIRDSAASASVVLALSERVGRLEKTQGKAGQVVLAAVQLQNAVNSGRGYALEAESLSVLTPGNIAVHQVVAALAPAAADGIPTPNRLARWFRILEPQALRIGLLPSEHGWWRQTLEHLLDLVIVRREDGTQAGSATAAHLARAAEALDADDLGAAVAEIADLSEPEAATVMAPWLAAARQRLEAERLLSRLIASLLIASAP